MGYGSRYYFTGPIEWDPGILICMGILAVIGVYMLTKTGWPKL